MIALVLAAGYATRLYPLTKDRPKPLLPLGGSTILDRLVDELERVPGLSHIYVVSNHRFIEPFRAWAGARRAAVPVSVLDDGSLTPEDRLGAIGDIAWAIREAGPDEDVLAVAAEPTDLAIGTHKAKARALVVRNGGGGEKVSVVE